MMRGLVSRYTLRTVSERWVPLLEYMHNFVLAVRPHRFISVPMPMRIMRVACVCACVPVCVRACVLTCACVSVCARKNAQVSGCHFPWVTRWPPVPSALSVLTHGAFPLPNKHFRSARTPWLSCT